MAISINMFGGEGSNSKSGVLRSKGQKNMTSSNFYDPSMTPHDFATLRHSPGGSTAGGPSY